MSVIKLYDELFKQGVFINVSGDKLIFEAKNPPAEKIIETIKANKNLLIDFLNGNQNSNNLTIKNILLRILISNDFYAEAKEYFEERAGIYESEGEHSRDEAELLALDNTINQFNRSVN